MHYYLLGNQLAFHFETPVPEKLADKLVHHKTDKLPPGSVAIELYGFSARGLKGVPWRFYKGVPWRAETVYRENGTLERVVFQAPFFRIFLFVRLVLLPLLWLLAVRAGGFYLLGTVFVKNDTTTLLFASPGAGKTRMTLQMLANENIDLIGDGSFIYLPGEGFITVLREIELRHKTVAGLTFYQKLTWLVKFRLLLCHIISFMTGRYISFNVTLPPEALGLSFVNDHVTAGHRVEYVHSFCESEEIRNGRITANIISYLQTYVRCYANIYSGEWPMAQTKEKIADFIEKYDLVD